MSNSAASSTLRPQIKEMWEAGDSASQIGEALGLTRCSVLGQVHRMKLALHQNKGTPRPARQRTPPKPVAIIPAEEITPLHIDMMQITNATCRFPYGDGPFTFCGHPRAEKSVYCQFHSAVSFAKPQVVR